MRVSSNPAEFRRWRRAERMRDGTVGFVPTMGALHQGHEALIARARRECDWVAVSIFVNPTQFNDPEDCEKYPRPLDSDLARCADLGVDLVFAPAREDLYPDDYTFRISENQISTVLEGEFRPGHFDGVLTVVMKLLQVVGPDRAYFGEKDWQQLELVKGLASAFFLPVEIVGCPIVREKDGLAMSSRNLRLSPDDRARAPRFVRALRTLATLDEVRNHLAGEGFEVEYVEDRDGRRLGAVMLGGIRLIDNIPLSEVLSGATEQEGVS